MRDSRHEVGADARCARVAAAQHGVIHRAQALAAGLSPSGISRRCEAGLWARVLPCVYVLTSVPTSALQRCAAAVLWAGPGAALGFETAATLLGILDRMNVPVHVVAVRQLRSPVDQVMVHRTKSLAGPDITVVQGLPVTSASRTLLDWAAVTDEEELEEAVDRALRLGLTSLPRLRWQLARESAKGRAGCGPLARVVELRGRSLSESALETRFRRLLRRYRLPEPVTQFRVRAKGRVVARLDFAYPDQRVGVEVDGYEYHSSRISWARDLARANDLVQAGWKVLHFTWDDLRVRPNEVATQMRTALAGGSPGERSR